MTLLTQPPKPALSTSISPQEMTAEQLALSSSSPRFASTQYGQVQGGTTKNGAAVFLNVPYALPVPRWTQSQRLPSGFEYSSAPYIHDAAYCAQPSRYYTSQIPVRQRLGLGQPTESPFFADIYVPSSVPLAASSPTSLSSTPALPRLPVRVFLHGGFLNFGSTSGQNYNQQFFAAEEFGEVRVLLGHRVSVFGFLASEKHGLEGNYGFRDCWTGLEWVRDNIAAFGGDPDQIHLSGLSGGSHIVHQLLHYASRQSPKKAPFISAFLQSNAILSNPLPPSAKEPQFDALASALRLHPHSDPRDILKHLRESCIISTEDIVRAVEGMGFHSIFRGVAGEGGWVSADQMEYQHSGGLARGLLAAGVQYVIMGDVRDENAFYSIVHPCQAKEDMISNLERFYPPADARKSLEAYSATMPTNTLAECDALQGQIFADGQVHLSTRILARDLVRAGMPVVRYAVEWVAKGLKSNGVISHGSDLPLHHYRLSVLTSPEAQSVLGFHQAIDSAVAAAVHDPQAGPHGDEGMVLTMAEDGRTGWVADGRWAGLRVAERALGLDP